MAPCSLHILVYTLYPPTLYWGQCVMQKTAEKATEAVASALGSLLLLAHYSEEASCHVLKTVEQPYGAACVVRN